MIDSENALRRLLDLLAVPGVTGEERGVIEHVRAEVLRLGVPESAVIVDDAPSRIPLPSQSGNLIVKLPGTRSGPSRLLMAHVDTVPLVRGAQAVVDGDRIRPSGATALGGDDRTGVAAILTALAEITQRGLPHAPVTFLFTVREESGLRGAAAVRKETLGSVEMGFNFDGSLPHELTIGAVGAAHLEITIRGIAAHAGVHPERGVSAAAILAGAITALERGGWLGKIQQADGSGTSNVGVLRGGEATNVVLDRLDVSAEARSHDPAFLQRIVSQFREELSKAAAARTNEAGERGRVEIAVEDVYPSYALPKDHVAIAAARAAIASAGLAATLRISNGGLDASWLTHKGVPTVSLGCGQREIHTTGEYVVINDYLKSCQIAAALALG